MAIQSLIGQEIKQTVNQRLDTVSLFLEAVTNNHLWLYRQQKQNMYAALSGASQEASWLYKLLHEIRFTKSTKALAQS